MCKMGKNSINEALEKIEQLIKELKKGPPPAEIKDMKIEWRKDEGYVGFSIKI